jgi:hypothetical protein
MRAGTIHNLPRFSAFVFGPLLFVGADPLTMKMLQAQALTGAIVGQVVESAGAAVADAKINVRNTDASSTRTLTCGADGEFRVTGLCVWCARFSSQSEWQASEAAFTQCCP